MKIIVYKMRLNSYECADVKDDGGDDVRIIFDKPLSGTLTVKDKILPLVNGICKTSVRELCDGECAPTLFTSGKKYKLESFFIKDGFILRRSPDGEYVRELCENYYQLKKRVSEIEAELEKINGKITQKIKF